MTAKTGIIERLGEKAVLPPSLMGEALAANDRIKLRLSLLQEAALQAQTPNRSARQFTVEQRAAGLADSSLDALVAGARMVGAARLFIPGVGPLLAGIADDLAAMLAPPPGGAGSGQPSLGREGRGADESHSRRRRRSARSERNR